MAAFSFRGVDWKWAVMALVALYGAALSTYNAYAAKRINKRQVRVKLSHGLVTSRLSDDMLILEASNPGHRPVTLTGVGLILPDKRQLIFPFSEEGSAPLPHQLNEGSNVTHWMPAREVAGELIRKGFPRHVELVAFYRDASDKCHKSNALTFDTRRS